jgi:glycosyltransferase A (GT-A) superfamily protein (DUF2064 family)
VTASPLESAATLLVIAKQPVPGRVKTRLVPPCAHEQAASLLTVDWHAADAVFGPADDGGFWALGLRVPDPALLRGVPMPTTRTGAIQRARLVAAGLRVADLPQLRDVDTAADAVAVARQAPRSRFAARARELATVLCPFSIVTAGSVLGETA